MTTETPDPKTTGTVIKELAAKLSSDVPAVDYATSDGRVFVIHRNDFMLVEKTLPNAADVLMPKVANCHAAIHTTASLIDYVNRFKNADTVLFASEPDNSIVAVIDYHKKADEAGVVAARLGSQMATLTLRYADEWATWTAQDQRLVSHLDFATFLEENQFDVSKPSGAELLELCRDLQVKQDVSFGSSVRMGDTVSINFQKEDDVSSKSQMQLPVNFETTIPVFFGEAPVRVLNWTRRNVSNSRLSLGYKMAQREQTEAREFARIVSEVQAGTECPIIFGKRQA